MQVQRRRHQGGQLEASSEWNAPTESEFGQAGQDEGPDDLHRPEVEGDHDRGLQQVGSEKYLESNHARASMDK